MVCGCFFACARWGSCSAGAVVLLLFLTNFSFQKEKKKLKCFCELYRMQHQVIIKFAPSYFSLGFNILVILSGASIQANLKAKVFTDDDSSL